MDNIEDFYSSKILTLLLGTQCPNLNLKTFF